MKKKRICFIFQSKERQNDSFCDSTIIDVYEMYVQAQRVCIISRLRGLCTFLLTLLLYWKCLIFPVYLFLYSYNYASQPTLESLCVCLMVVPRLCVNGNNLHGVSEKRQRKLLPRKMRMYVFVVIHCCWSSCIPHTIPIAAAQPMTVPYLTHINDGQIHTHTHSHPHLPRRISHSSSNTKVFRRRTWNRTWKYFDCVTLSRSADIVMCKFLENMKCPG